MRMKSLALGGAVVATVAIGFASPSANAAGGPEIASMNAGVTALVWQPAATYERMTLRVTGPGGTFTREFEGAIAPSFDLYDGAGYPLADGVYKWELRATPVLSNQDRARLARARALGDDSVAAELRAAGKLPSEPMVVSGTFGVRDGAFVRDADEPTSGGPRSMSGALSSMQAETVIVDDLIVQSSICVGFDCVNGENFGADTLRLKENNLRIHFLDTSNSGSFPANDWRIVINDTTNGGLNHFSIEDSSSGRTVSRIEAGAPSNSFYVDDGGRIGLGTNQPVVELQVVDGDTPTLRLEQDGSSGFTPQTWDVAGNEAGFFVRDVTNGGVLPFRIRRSVANDFFNIGDSSGNERVGIGTLSPSETVHVTRSDGNTKLLISETNGTAAARDLLELSNNGDVFFRQTNTATGQFVDVNLIGDEFRLNFGTGGGGPELRLGNTGDLIVTGNVFSASCAFPGSPCAPDYVFESDYELMDLDQLASFVAENKHLPNVPSEAEFIAQRKLNLGQFQMTLLEKIEELTLYTLQQHETIAVLQAEVAALKEAAEAD